MTIDKRSCRDADAHGRRGRLWPVTAQDALKGALRDVVAPHARSHGYKGTAPTWRKFNDAGDWAVVNVQSSSFSTSESLLCVINLAVAPEPWLRWRRERSGKAMPKSVTEYLGLYRQRLHPAGTPEDTDGWWEISDAESAVVAATDMIAQLEAAGWPLLDRMLQPGGMLQQVRSGDLGMVKQANFEVFFACAAALLLMDAGPSDELETNLHLALAGCMPSEREDAHEFDQWVRQQASSAA